ncbi:hypothetical protein OG323_09225 [Streptomyces cyaneofuscatus]|uniref:hypothetical protein n=1 Tax=Streptomyces cyaneofuscatus TaxID=66883 RepID=UPI003868AF4C|nr:hypothetical protein OG323_09225 [Streptomyces cyaneofuscatus]
MGEVSDFRWVDSNFPNSYVDGSGRTGMSVEGASLKLRAEASHAHADYRIKNHQNVYDQIDAMLALKRSMQTRLDHLDSLYRFKQYPECAALGWLGILERWGVIRKRMLHRMKQLRNAVEHDGAEPPSLGECEDYAEVTWWFLRGTSPLLSPLDMIDYTGAAFGVVNYSYNPLKISVRIDLVPEMVSDSPVPGWSKIKISPRGERRGQFNRSSRDETQFQDFSTVEGVVADPGSAHQFLENAFRELL